MIAAPWAPTDTSVHEHVARCLEPWIGTPYGAGQGVAGVATDCVRSLAGIGAALEGSQPREVAHLPVDTAFHNRDRALRAMREIMQQFPLWDRLKPIKQLQPGDMLVVGPSYGGPGHAIFVSHRPNMLAEATPTGFHYTGIGSIREDFRVFAQYRYSRREDWK